MPPTVPRDRYEHPERKAQEPCWLAGGRPPAPPDRTLGHTGTVRVLVVEDERRLASAVRRGLTAEGFVVDVAHDGVDGLHLAREGGYDAVVLDLMLPGLSGYQVCERLRAERNWVPVLILSAKDGEYDQADGLDLAARTVRRAEEPIELTAREFALLEYLMRRAGQVVPKAELLEHVWDSDAVADINVVEVYAGYLRRKIDAPFGKNALQTVRGAGYRLAADGG